MSLYRSWVTNWHQFVNLPFSAVGTLPGPVCLHPAHVDADV